MGYPSAWINSAIGDGNVVISLAPNVYDVMAPINGNVADITLQGVPGKTKFLKDAASGASGILRIDQVYNGWTFDGIEFDGNARAIIAEIGTGTFTAFISGSRRVRFVRCIFRDTYFPVSIRDSSDILFEDCDFFGTRPSGLTPSIDPAADPDAFFTNAIAINAQVRRVRFVNCRFHFTGTGITGNAVAGESGSDLQVQGCEFRSDWWDSPLALLRFQATSVAIPGIIVLTVTGVPGFAAALADNKVISFRREITTGSAFTQIFVGNVQAAGTPFADATVGDVIETADGRRATLAAIASSTSANVEGWEWIDTYEPCDPPALATTWRLSRYYACGTQNPTSTTVDLYFEPVNPYTGERAVTDAGLDLTTLPARVLAKTSYSGIHLNGYINGVFVSGNTFRGSWADQCSLFDMPEGARIV